jgi:hypothetical protein
MTLNFNSQGKSNSFVLLISQKNPILYTKTVNCNLYYLRVNLYNSHIYFIYFIIICNIYNILDYNYELNNVSYIYRNNNNQIK